VAGGAGPALAGRERWRWALAAAVGLAVAARVALLVGTVHLPLLNDPADYHRLAVSLAGGHGFGTTVVAPGGGPTAFRPPLWPLFLGGIYTVVGDHVLVARGVEVVLGVITVGLVGALAFRLARSSGRDGRRTALVAMALAAVYPPLLLAGGSLLSESLSLPLELGSLLVAWVAPRARRPLRWCALAGLLCGLDILCRPESFILLVPALLLACRRPRDEELRSRLRAGSVRAALLVGAAGLTVTPWLVRDAVVMGRFVPVTTQGGLVASGTYNDTAAHDPVHPAAWRPANLVPEYRHLLRGTEIQEESALRAAALHYIRTHPAYPLRVAGWNLVRLFDLNGRGEARGSWGANGYSPGIANLDAYGLLGLAALAAYGSARRLGRARRRARPPAAAVFDGPEAPARAGNPRPWPLWLAPVLLVLVTIPVLGESRLRVGIDPFLVLLVARVLVA
jgi:hypothetical protein